MLEVHRELSQVAGNLEAMKGHLTYLERSSSLATIRLTISNPKQFVPVPGDKVWSPLRTFYTVCPSTLTNVQLAYVALTLLYRRFLV